MRQIELYTTLAQLSFVDIKVEMQAKDSVVLDGWIGAHIRNMLFAKTEQVKVEDGRTLRDVFNTLTLQEDHPLYKEINGGFPKGYAIKIHSKHSACIAKGEVIDFSFILVGTLGHYTSQAVEAIKILATQGIRRMSFVIDNISIKRGCFSDYMHMGLAQDQRLSLELITPVSLYKSNKKSPQDSFQARMNGFPSLYQFVLSAAHRASKLALLYCDTYPKTNHTKVKELIEQLALVALSPQLEDCTIHKAKTESAPRADTARKMVFCGYRGTLSWSGSELAQLLPLLAFVSHINIGDDTVYGMGQYAVLQ